MSEGTLQHDGLRGEQLAAIGDRLRQQRESLGLSLDAVCARTKIQRRLLVAIETAQVAILPEPVYVRGFIRQYGNAVGLNGSELAEQYPIESVNVPRTINGIIPTPNVRPLHLYGLYVLLLVASVVGLSIIVERSRSWNPAQSTPDAVASPAVAPPPPAPAPSPEASPSASPTEVAASPEPSPSPEASPSASPTEAAASPEPSPSPETSPSASPAAAAASPAPAPDSEPTGEIQQARAISTYLKFPRQAAFDPESVRVDMVAKDDSWVRVVVDGKVEFEGVIKAGSEQGWSAKESLVVRSGNAGGVVLSRNGSDPKPMGDRGTIAEQEFTTERPSS